MPGDVASQLRIRSDSTENDISETDSVDWSEEEEAEAEAEAEAASQPSVESSQEFRMPSDDSGEVGESLAGESEFERDPSEVDPNPILVGGVEADRDDAEEVAARLRFALRTLSLPLAQDASHAVTGSETSFLKIGSRSHSLTGAEMRRSRYPDEEDSLRCSSCPQHSADEQSHPSSAGSMFEDAQDVDVSGVTVDIAAFTQTLEQSIRKAKRRDSVGSVGTATGDEFVECVLDFDEVERSRIQALTSPLPSSDGRKRMSASEGSDSRQNPVSALPRPAFAHAVSPREATFGDLGIEEYVVAQQVDAQPVRRLTMGQIPDSIFELAEHSEEESDVVRQKKKKRFRDDWALVLGTNTRVIYFVDGNGDSVPIHVVEDDENANPVCPNPVALAFSCVAGSFFGLMGMLCFLGVSVAQLPEYWSSFAIIPKPATFSIKYEALIRVLLLFPVYFLLCHVPGCALYGLLHGFYIGSVVCYDRRTKLDFLGVSSLPETYRVFSAMLSQRWELKEDILVFFKKHAFFPFKKDAFCMWMFPCYPRETTSTEMALWWAARTHLLDDGADPATLLCCGHSYCGNIRAVDAYGLELTQHGSVVVQSPSLMSVSGDASALTMGPAAIPRSAFHRNSVLEHQPPSVSGMSANELPPQREPTMHHTESQSTIDGPRGDSASPSMLDLRPSAMTQPLDNVIPCWCCMFAVAEDEMGEDDFDRYSGGSVTSDILDHPELHHHDESIAQVVVTNEDGISPPVTPRNHSTAPTDSASVVVPIPTIVLTEASPEVPRASVDAAAANNV
eukprot:ANDGO_07830.mRNA.1 hypothetical protein